MKNLRKILLITASTLAVVTSSIADNITADKMPVVSDLKVTLSGYVDFQAELRNQNHLSGDEKNVSKNRENFAFYNSAAMIADVSNKISDITYGGKIVLVPTAKRKGYANYSGTHVYIKSEFGHVEAGSPMPASSNMMVDESDIATTFDDWARYSDFSTKHLMQTSAVQASFATFAEFFLDNKLTTELDERSYSSEPTRSISYYTPKFAFGNYTKLQAGITYSPDSSNTGADSPDTHSRGIDKRDVRLEGIDKFKIDSTVKDAISGGVALEQNLGDGIDLKVALTGEYGKAAEKVKKFATEKENDSNPTELKLSNLRTFNIGAILNVGNFFCAGSFGSLGKSLTTPAFHKTGCKTNYYTGTVAYKQGPFAASVSCFKSDQFKNTVDSVSIGTHYQMTPGFVPYITISSFSLKGRPEFNSRLKKKKTRGTVALIGTKLSL